MMLVVQALRVLRMSWKKVFFPPARFNSWCQILDNMIGWMLTNADKVMLKLNLWQLQCDPDTCDATLAPASYCEPTFSKDAFNNRKEG